MSMWKCNCGTINNKPLFGAPKCSKCGGLPGTQEPVPPVPETNGEQLAALARVLEEVIVRGQNVIIEGQNTTVQILQEILARLPEPEPVPEPTVSSDDVIVAKVMKALKAQEKKEEKKKG